jgi:hypothetical protein
MGYANEAANVLGPRANSGTDVRRTQTQAVAAASTAAVDTLASQDTTDQGMQNRWWVTMVCTQDCFICFGDASVAAATANDWPLFANQPKDFFLDRNTRYFRVIRSTADGTLKWYGSG